jgi:hypothetical protein
MLTLVFVFMLFNLTIIWNLPTISTGGHGSDGVPGLIGPRARFFVHSLTQKSGPARHPAMQATSRNFVPRCASQFGKSRLPSQSDRSPPYPI